ncbi:hypothetical protein DPMN_006194 [Dreissena polymorpha]|uniref:Uncharacterized protein n=1 Tax=Dreissena polymorpha TaxID=45954 RepID=A0A9D4MRY8_DREPO|nr:hypothetical protein DPMN_006194 [Dreissena polymorpha]
MRAAAAEQAKQTKGSSGRGGMMGVFTFLTTKANQTREETPQQSDTPEGEEGRLQERLAETEAQMSKILQAMQSVQNKMGDVTAPSSSTNQNASAAQKAEDGQNVWFSLRESCTIFSSSIF